MGVRAVVREYIPYTQARRDRLFQTALVKEVGAHDGLAIVEWEDGSVTLKPVNWESAISAIIDDDGNMWFARGLGSKPKDFNGIALWYVYAGNAGVVSTEASLIADAERHGDVVDVGDGESMPDDLFELGLQDPNSGRLHGEEGPAAGERGPQEPLTPAAGPGTGGGNGHPGRARADGGMINVDENAAVYDLRPPAGYDGVAFSVRDPDYFDPYPVTREDAKAAAEWFERAVDDGTDTWMKGFIVGILVFAFVWLIMTVIPWLLAQIGGGGGGGVGNPINGLLPLLAVPGARRSLVDGIAGRVGEVVEVI